MGGGSRVMILLMMLMLEWMLMLMFLNILTNLVIAEATIYCIILWGLLAQSRVFEVLISYGEARLEWLRGRAVALSGFMDRAV